MMQHSTLRRHFCFSVLGTAVLMIIKAQPVGARQFEGQERGKCDAHHEACTKSLANCEVTLDIHPKPVKAMRLLSFQVTISGSKPSGSPFIDLGMPGMDMGPNMVFLKPLGEMRYEGNGIIVRCSSGKRTWRATVVLPGLGSVDFFFDVIY